MQDLDLASESDAPMNPKEGEAHTKLNEQNKRERPPGSTPSKGAKPFSHTEANQNESDHKGNSNVPR